jgi:hypothetical protein
MKSEEATIVHAVASFPTFHTFRDGDNFNEVVAQVSID